MLGLGPGWYHFGTSADETFRGHPGEADFFVFDFGVTTSGQALAQGQDAITHFERALDGIVILNGYAEIGPGVSINSVAEGVGRHGGFEETIEYSLVRLEFVGGVASETQIGDIGHLRFVDLI